jgi:hypothetical protein
MQRILLIGFSIDDSLQRMIEWLSENYGVDINAITLRYIKSKNGEEFIARTVIVPEEFEESKVVTREEEKVIEKVIEKLGFRRIPNSKYFFLILS